MVLKIDTKFEGKLTCASKNDMRNDRALEGVKIGTLMATFCLELKMYELKIYRRVICHHNEE